MATKSIVARGLKACERGVTLVEVLVSVVVLSLGLLGVAGIYIQSLRFNQNSQFRSIALQQAIDMSDRIRANHSGMEAGSYNNVTTTIPTNPSCGPCSSSQLAQLDAYEWNTGNATYLPSGQGTVTGDGTTFVVTVMWDNDRSGATGTSCGSDKSVDLTCMKFNVQL